MPEKRYHHTHRTGWLRAAVMGANDGIISTSGLLLGVAAAHATHAAIVVTGITGLVAGAIAMAAGEYVSVKSQADMEEADLALERGSLAANHAAEREELAAIYVERGLEPGLAREVAQQLMARNALSAHARDELGISDALRARPLQASIASGACFACGAALPLLSAAAAPMPVLSPIVAGNSLFCLALLGGLAARLGGARVITGALRVLLWGALALGATAAIGTLIGAA